MTAGSVEQAPRVEVMARALLPSVLTDGPDDQVVTDLLFDQVDLAVDLERLVDELADLLEDATAAATRTAYQSDLSDFTAWASEHRLAALPADPRTVALYVTDQHRTLRPSTLLRRLSAIAVAHRSADYPSRPGTSWSAGRSAASANAADRRPPKTRWSPRNWRSSANGCTTAPSPFSRQHPRPNSKGKLPSPQAHARTVAAGARVHAARAFAARRDRALLLVGYAAALRRSELVGLDVGDLTEHADGLMVHIARSKTDQLGLGDYVGIAHGHPASTCTHTCPIRAWQEWGDALAAALHCQLDEIPEDSPAFRPITRHGHLGVPGNLDPHARLTGQAVALLVKDAVDLLDDPRRFPRRRYAGHSLRAGFATQAAAAGVPLYKIMRQTRHASVAVAMRYIRDADLWRDNPSAALGL